MKRFLLIVLIILLLLIVKIPKYEELNNAIIIDRIYVSCSNKVYNVKLREIIPRKDNNGIIFDYKYYYGNGNNLTNITYNINPNKLFYYKKYKLITDCSHDELKYFKIK